MSLRPLLVIRELITTELQKLSNMALKSIRSYKQLSLAGSCRHGKRRRSMSLHLRKLSSAVKGQFLGVAWGRVLLRTMRPRAIVSKELLGWSRRCRESARSEIFLARAWRFKLPKLQHDVPMSTLGLHMPPMPGQNTINRCFHSLFHYLHITLI